MRAAKIDRNQPEIVQALRNVGASVQSLSSVGKGVPDLLVGFRGVNFLLEIKDGTKPPSQKSRTVHQVDWHVAWRGSVRVVESPAEALAAIGL